MPDNIQENVEKKSVECKNKIQELINFIIKQKELILLMEIDSIGKDSIDQNVAYNDKIEKLSEIRKQINNLEAQRVEKEKIISQYTKEIEEFDNKSAKILKQITDEKTQAEYNKKIILSYNKVIHMLVVYNKSLPEYISRNLEERIVEYYRRSITGFERRTY